MYFINNRDNSIGKDGGIQIGKGISNLVKLTNLSLYL